MTIINPEQNDQQTATDIVMCMFVRICFNIKCNRIFFIWVQLSHVGSGSENDLMLYKPQVCTRANGDPDRIN